MSFNFDETLAGDRDVIRAALDDIVEAAAEFSDEAIDAVLARSGGTDAAFVFLGRQLTVRFAKRPGAFTSTSGMSVAWRERASVLSKLVEAVATGETSIVPGEANDIAGLFDVAEMVVDDFSSREFLANERLRSLA